MKLVLIECVVLCILFAAVVMTIATHTNPLTWVYNYPPYVVKRCEELHLIEPRTVNKKTVYTKKLIFCVLVGILFGLVMRYVNQITEFLPAALTTYLIWLVVDWFDFLVLDSLWFMNNKSLTIPGTEDLPYPNGTYAFHAMASLRGMLLGVIFAVVAGIVVILL